VDDRAVAEILAVLLRVPVAERLDTFAIAIRAVLDLGLLEATDRLEAS
jgi:hypothetical protein